MLPSALLLLLLLALDGTPEPSCENDPRSRRRRENGIRRDQSRQLHDGLRRLRRERPAHEVKISKKFWMQTTEVTQAQWQAVMGANPSEFKGPDLPVENVSWDDCMEFTKKLSAKVQDQLQGRKPALPTEAEWEFACRAGTKTPWSFGDDDKMAGQFAWHSGNSDEKTNPVGSKKPNPWGLYDMHGNVWEWCSDWYVEEHPAGPATDPQGPEKGNGHVRRGGAWAYWPGKQTSSTRDKDEADYRFKTLGMRAVLR